MEDKIMKRYITTFLMAIMLAAIVPVLVNTANAQTRYLYDRNGRVVVLKRPNLYRRHRKAFNIGGGALAGGLIGGLIGGRKGLLIGGLAGAGGGALFNHKQRPQNYYRRSYARRSYSTRRTYRNY